MEWCTVTWTRSLSKIAMFGHFSAFHGTLKFSMISLDQGDKIEEITLRHEIWWHDVVYHEADHCMKWPHSNIRIFWSRSAEGAVVLWTSCRDLFNILLSAFRKHYNRQSLLLKLIEDIKSALGQIYKTDAVFMDSSKAFDCLSPCFIFNCKIECIWPLYNRMWTYE